MRNIQIWEKRKTKHSSSLYLFIMWFIFLFSICPQSYISHYYVRWVFPHCNGSHLHESPNPTWSRHLGANHSKQKPQNEPQVPLTLIVFFLNLNSFIKIYSFSEKKMAEKFKSKCKYQVTHCSQSLAVWFGLWNKQGSNCFSLSRKLKVSSTSFLTWSTSEKFQILQTGCTSDAFERAGITFQQGKGPWLKFVLS